MPTQITPFSYFEKTYQIKRRKPIKQNFANLQVTILELA